MQISVIIPTFEEEKYLPKLLACLKRQTFRDFEVIVADAGSQDKTIEIAKKFGAKVVKGGTPAQGRNNGAKHATGDFLFFFDADITFSSSFLQKTHEEIQERFLDLATCTAKPISKLHVDKLLHKTVNVLIKMRQFSPKPLAGGFCILVSKRLFQKMGGFDETLKLGEDHDFVERATKIRKLRVLTKSHINVSIRRLSKEGRITLSRKYIQAEIHRTLFGKIRKDIMNYEFGNYTQQSTNNLEKQLVALDRKYDAFLRKYLQSQKQREKLDSKLQTFKQQLKKILVK